ncbi:MAG: signal recognition particle protein [Lentisphaeria bacterium]|nr:signal recognition particle protein [Lentisphaeria bacterium]
MFNNLTDRFQQAFRSLTGRGHLTESNISDALNEIRKALLEADVNYQVTKQFVADVREECLGEAVMKSVTPGQQAVKVVHDKLVALLGESAVPLELSGSPAVIMLCGLHGSGKTTTSAKLALHLRDKQKRKVMLAACDVNRPAAIDQLEFLGKDLGVPVFLDRDLKDVPKLALLAVDAARKQGCDTLILDTAGRLQIDQDLVQELADIKRRVQPKEILLVGDAALGQEAVSVAEHFDQALGITGIILTKLDGDARGGAALSMRQVTGKPVKFVTVGERPIDLEVFHPDRMAQRILNMGDVVSLVEKAAEQFEEDEAKELEERLFKNAFGFDDFLGQLNKIRKMGGFASLLKFLPGMGNLPLDQHINDDAFKRIEGIINSMTAKERRQPEIIGLPRRQRIAKGSGVQVNEVNQLLKQFSQMKAVMAKLGQAGGPSLGGLFGGGMPNMGGMGGMGGGMPPLPGMGGMGGMGLGMGMGGGGGSSQSASQAAKRLARKKMAEKSKKKNRNKKK